MLASVRNLARRAAILLLDAFFVLVYALQAARDLLAKGPRAMVTVKQRSRPDVLNDPKLGEHGFARLQDVTLHYVVNGPEDAPLMLLLHGFPENWYSWRYQLQYFSQTYRVIALDMRGFGESSKPTDVNRYNITELADDIKEFLDYMGYESCVLVGHDWGGFVGWTVASLYPALVERLVLCNIPHPRAFLRYMFAFQWKFLPEFYMRADDLGGLVTSLTGEGCGAKPGTFSEEDIEAFKYYFNDFYEMTGPINYYRAMWRDLEGFTVADGVLSCPVMTVWGDGDGFLAAEMAELSSAYARDYIIKYVPDGSHWIQQEEPTVVNNHIQEFLNSAKLE